MELVKKISNEISKILDKDEALIERMIERPKELKNGDYCLPCFAFAKELKKSPQEIAQNIKENLKMDEIQNIEVVSGFLNIFINKNLLIGSVFEEIDSKNVEYGSSIIGKNKTIK